MAKLVPYVVAFIVLLTQLSRSKSRHLKIILWAPYVRLKEETNTLLPAIKESQKKTKSKIIHLQVLPTWQHWPDRWDSSVFCRLQRTPSQWCRNSYHAVTKVTKYLTVFNSLPAKKTDVCMVCGICTRMILKGFWDTLSFRRLFLFQQFIAHHKKQYCGIFAKAPLPSEALQRKQPSKRKHTITGSSTLTVNSPQISSITSHVEYNHWNYAPNGIHKDEWTVNNGKADGII